MMLDCRIGALRRGVAWLGLTMCACYSTCDGSPAAATATGELGNGTFEYRCIGTSDPVCEDGVFSQPFPDCIAVGGAFRLDYTLRDISERDEDELTPFLHIEAANTSFLGGEGGSFHASRPGRTAVLAYDNDVVVDLLHMELVQPDALELQGLDPAAPTDELHMRQGEVAVFRVFPRSSSCAGMGGAVDFVADSSDSSVATVGTPDVLEIESHKVGHTTVTVALGELTTSIEVFVEAATRTNPPPGSVDGSSGESSGDGGSSSDATGGSDTSGSTGG
jgi:hypothetical protein